MLPLLEFARDGHEYTLAEAREVLAAHFQLSVEERNELLPLGRQRLFDNRVAWAKYYLNCAGLVRSPQRGRFQITDRGRTVLQEAPPRIDIAFLDQFEEFREFRLRRFRRGDDKSAPIRAGGTTEGAFQFDLSPQEEIMLMLLVGRELYGLQLTKAIEEASEGKLRMTFGSLYPMLHRLEEKGFVSSRWGDEKPEERSGARRRYYVTTVLGEQMLRETQRLRANFAVWRLVGERIR
jgi:PadR family transcriptional regulator PadR